MNQLELVEHYRAEGYYAPIPFLEKEEVTYYRAKLAELEHVLDNPLRRMDQSHCFFAWAYDLATHPKLMDLMEHFLGPELLIHSTRIFRKPPFSDSFVSWHQDGRYTDLNDKIAPTIWIALSDSKIDNGCVQVVPRSFGKGTFPHIETFAESNLLNAGEIAQVEIASEEIVSLELNPGELSIHNVNLLHSSLANSSSRERCGFSLTVTTPDMFNSFLPAVQGKGKDPLTGVEVWGRPEEGSVEEAIKAHRDFHIERGLPYRL